MNLLLLLLMALQGGLLCQAKLQHRFHSRYTNRDRFEHLGPHPHLQESDKQRPPSSDSGSSGSPGFVVDVLEFGANGDGATDNTDAFAKAIAAATANGGGIVYVPSGNFLFSGHFTVSSGVTLKGSYTVVPSHSHVPGWNLTDGTVLLPTEGRGNAGAPAFVTVEANAVLSNVVVFHKLQEETNYPVEYPWSVMMVGNNAAVTDVELLNSWNGINATQAHRHYIARVQGQPLNIGVLVDATYDIGRIEDVHFNPWYSDTPAFMAHQLTHGKAFVFGRSDWEYVFNTFAFGYAVGYHFIHTSTGNMNGNFLGIGADLAINASVLVDASQAPGILITNGEFTAFPGTWIKTAQESSQVVVGAGNAGPVKFVDSSFWGPSSQIALLYGSSTTSFSSCEFVQWDEQKKDGRAAIRAFAGNLIVQGSEFAEAKKQVELGLGVKKAIVTGNIFAGKQDISVASNLTKVEIAHNL